MNSNWKEEAWKTEVHVMADRTIKTKIEGREIYDWSEQHHRTGNKKMKRHCYHSYIQKCKNRVR